MIEDCQLGDYVSIPFDKLVNLYGCTVGDLTFIGPFVEIQRGVTIGKLCKIQSHAFLCTGVTVGDRVFIGHGVMTTNDLFPAIDVSTSSTTATAPELVEGRRLFCTVIGDDAVIGSNATLLPVRIGQGAVVGAGAVVVADVPAWSCVVGNPAYVIRQFTGRQDRNRYYATHPRDNLLAIQG